MKTWIDIHNQIASHGDELLSSVALVSTAPDGKPYNVVDVLWQPDGKPVMILAPEPYQEPQQPPKEVSALREKATSLMGKTVKITKTTGQAYEGEIEAVNDYKDGSAWVDLDWGFSINLAEVKSLEEAKVA